MQRDRDVRDESTYSGGPFDSFGSFGGFGPFGSFGSFGPQRSMMSRFFGARDPFDDPFFTRPFGNVSGSSMFSSGVPFRDLPQVGGTRGPVIEELLTDEDEEIVDDMGASEEKDDEEKNNGSNQHPHVQLPDDQADGRTSKDVRYRAAYNKVEGTKPQTPSVSFQKVTYGGLNGAYYTATTTRRTGNDGVVLEECKQADRTTGQATHRVSRGIQDKGHSVTRKLGSDGKVDTMQALHNLNEDELHGFEQAWKGNAERHLPPSGDDGWFNFNGTAGASRSSRSGRSSGTGWALPFEGFSGRSEGMGAFNEARTAAASGGRPKKVIRINIE